MKVKSNLIAGKGTGETIDYQTLRIPGECTEYWGNGNCLFKTCPYPPYNLPCDETNNSQKWGNIGAYHYF